MFMKPEYEPTSTPITTNHGSVPNQLSARRPRSVPEMIDPAKAPERPHPSLTARPTLWLMV